MTVAIAAVIFVGGLVAGFLTGLLGIGGGVIMLPLLYQSLLHLQVDSKAAFTTAVATSLAVMIFSGSAAARNYHRQGLLDTRLILWAGVGTLLGAYGGAHILLAVNDRWVRLAFGLFLWLVAATLLLPRSRTHTSRPISFTVGLGLASVGVVMGTISALFGVGGGALLVPALVVLFGIALHAAIATSTAIIVLTALFGTASYLVLGWHDPQAPAHGLGWIDPLAFVLLLPGAMYATRYGVRAATALPRAQLRNVLMGFLVLIGARFVFASAFAA